jgi:flagellar biosynthesis protein FlhB
VSGRTEKPTPKRLREARRRGEVAVSRELTGLGALAGGAAALAATGSSLGARLCGAVRAAIAASGSADLPDAPRLALARAGALLVATLAPALAGAAAGAIGAGLLQTQGLLAPGAAGFRAERLDPARNLARIVSGPHLVAAGLAAAKASLAIALAAWSLRAVAPGVAELARLEPLAIASAGPRLLLPVAGRLLLLLAAFAVADLLLARARHLRGLRMTREEVRREHREDEGDPAHRAERRRRHRLLLEAAPVAQATCVVVNPTRLAIALRHDLAAGTAPIVVAKGAGAEAARIRAAARRAAVPIVRDVPLARALWRLSELGEEIPEPLYDAAAAVLVHVHGLSTGALS